MIVATAGHVDHGKTELIRALTGIETDRLPEEKRRGMTIDLGFAFLDASAGRTIGFVDVPGHERFVRNMLCGLARIDVALLAVAADDGIRQQTREHVSILDLIGVREGIVALTKRDRVCAARAAEVEAEVAGLLAPTLLAGAPAFVVSARTGAGMEALREHLIRRARERSPDTAKGGFRLAVDRAFDVAGAGLVVTGSVVSGSVRTGDRLRALVAGSAVRVRGLRVQGATAACATVGQRCALNLSGADLRRDVIGRGDWIVRDDAASPVRKFDARIRVVAGEARPLAHWTPVHVHLGTAETTGRVAVLGQPAIPPGGSAYVQLVTDRPIGAWRGDPLVLRDQAATRTVAGGAVIDIFPPVRRRAAPERLAYLASMDDPDDDTALSRLLAAAPRGLDLAKFASNRNLTPAEAPALFARIPMRRVSPAGADGLGFAPGRWQGLQEQALGLLAAEHRRRPDEPGVPQDRIATGCRLEPDVAVALVDDLVRDGALARQGTALRLPSHQPVLGRDDTALWDRAAPFLVGTSRPPVVGEIAEALGTDAKTVAALLARAARHGRVVRVSETRFFAPAALLGLGETAEEIAGEAPDGLLSVLAFRDRTRLGRNLAIDVLEFFDRIRFTRRQGAGRRILRPAADALTVADGRAEHTADGMERERTPVGRPDFKSGEGR